MSHFVNCQRCPEFHARHAASRYDPCHLLHHWARCWQMGGMKLPPCLSDKAVWLMTAITLVIFPLSLVAHTIDLSWPNVRACHLGVGLDLTAWQCELTRLQLPLYYLNKQGFFIHLSVSFPCGMKGSLSTMLQTNWSIRSPCCLRMHRERRLVFGLGSLAPPSHLH